MPDQPTPTPLLRARGLRFTRNDNPVFGPLDFEVDGGEALLVRGGNGSGKTTLLRVLAGLLRADAGRVEIDGRPAGSALRPTCVLDICTMELRLAVRKWKRARAGSCAIGPALASPRQIATMASSQGCSASWSSAGANACMRAGSISMAASRWRAPGQETITPTLMNSSRSTRGTTRMTA